MLRVGGNWRKERPRALLYTTCYLDPSGEVLAAPYAEVQIRNENMPSSWIWLLPLRLAADQVAAVLPSTSVH